MDEVCVDVGKVFTMTQGVEKLLTHAHQRRRTGWRKIEPPQQLLAQLGQTFGAGGAIDAAVARAVNQRPAAFGDAVEHLAKTGRVHV
jgi:hypothetical protein